MRSAKAWTVAVVGGLVALAVTPVVGAQEASSVAEVGWWTDNPAPNAPPDGFEVAQGPQGTLSEAAVRITINALSVSAATLSLSQSSAVGSPALQVCPTTASWSVASPGTLADAPKPDCSAPVPLTLNADAAVWTADVAALLQGSEVSLMVVPKPDPSLPLQIPFQAEFAKAELQSIGEFAPEPLADTSGTGGIASGAGTGFTDLGTADLGLANVAPAIEVPPLGEQAVTAPAQVPGRFPERPRVNLPDNGRRQPWGRLPLLLVAAAVAGTAASFGRRTLLGRGWLSTT